MNAKTTLIMHTGKGGPVRIPACEEEPAATVAGILARRAYGRRGTVVTLRMDSCAMDYSSATWQAFIGCGPPIGRDVAE